MKWAAKSSVSLLALTWAAGQVYVPEQAYAQTSPGFTPRQVLTATGLNTAFTNKQDVVSVKNYGAVCDGTTDDTTAINNALNSGNKHITIPAGVTCFSATGVTMQPNTEFSGGSFAFTYPNALVGNTSMLLCARNVAACLKIAGASSGGYVHDLAVGTTPVTGGTPPASGNCIQVVGGNGVTLERVGVFQCYDGYYWDNTAGLQIAGFMSHTLSTEIVDAHIVQDTTPELRIIWSRFGSDGPWDYNAQAFIRISGGNVGQQGILPNGLFVTNTQFNQGASGTVTNFVEFTNCLFCTGHGGQEWVFTNNHVENVRHLIATDASWTVLYGVQMTNNFMDTGTGAMLALNPATGIWNMVLTGNLLEGPFNFNSSTGTASFAIITGNIFALGNITLDSQSAFSDMNFTGNQINGTLTTQGVWDQLEVVGNIAAGGYVNTATIGRGATVAGDGTTLSMKGATQQVLLESSTALYPEIHIKSTSNDGNEAFIIFEKIRSASAVLNGDLLGFISFKGFANSAFQSSASISTLVDGTLSGSNVPSDLIFGVSSASSQNYTMLVLVGSAGQVKFSASQSFTVNGTATANLTATAISGHTTVQEWLTIIDSAGTVRYIPAY